MKKSEKRKGQIAWLNKLSRETGYNFTQIVGQANYFARKNGIKPISDSILRVFLSSKNNSILHDNTITLIAEAYETDLPSDLYQPYSIKEDNSDVSEYVKLCKQYVTDVCEAKGYTRNKLAGLLGKSNSYFSDLFKNKRIKGLSPDILRSIEKISSIKIPGTLLSTPTVVNPESSVELTGYISLSSSDEIIPLDEKKYIKNPLKGEKEIKAIELRGPTINPATKDGVIYFYEEAVAEEISNNCLDSLCYVETEDDIISVKYFSLSSKKGVYRLQSIIDNSIEHKPVKTASKIIYTSL